MDSTRPFRALLLQCCALACIQSRADAQDSNSVRRGRIVAPVVIGDAAEDRLRLRSITGLSSSAGWLIRSPATLEPSLASAGIAAHDAKVCKLRWAFVAPAVGISWNSKIPFGLNDGAQWAGRGATLRAAAGARAECGRVRLRFVPEIWYSQNRHFAIIASSVPNRGGFASPFHSAPLESADLPLRFGSEPLTVFGAGQISIEVDAGPVTIGTGTESQWWGPGLRNALIMSNHASGIPSVYLRSARPVRTPIGSIDARWMVGALSESPYFDSDGRNDLRSLSGLVIEWRPRLDSNLSIGATRVVYAPIGGAGALPARFLDAVGRWGEQSSVRSATFGRAADQLAALFARWVFPRSGVEAYGEWARVQLPWSIRTLFTNPQYSQGYTLGMQATTLRDPTRPFWRTQFEVTNLEQIVTSRGVDPPTFYVSPTVAQGYTNRGQIIGAGIGPGASSQWLAVDRMSPAWSVGAFFNRIRWENDRFYRQPTGFSIFAHDVSMIAGVRGTYRSRWVDYAAELVSEKRLNYLFQSAALGYNEDDTFDVHNVSLKLSLTQRDH